MIRHAPIAYCSLSYLATVFELGLLLRQFSQLIYFDGGCETSKKRLKLNTYKLIINNYLFRLVDGSGY